MIERLTHALQALAAPAEAQLARFPDFVAHADELALDYDDALRLVIDCPQIRLEPGQRRALERLDAHLERMSGAAHADSWTVAALRAAPEWAEARELARTALAALGLPVELPPPSAASDASGRWR